MAVAGEAGKEEEEPHCDVMEALTGCWGVGRANLVVWRDGAGQNCQRVASVEEERAGEKRGEVTRYSDGMPGEMRTKQNQENNNPQNRANPYKAECCSCLFAEKQNPPPKLPIGEAVEGEMGKGPLRLWVREGDGQGLGDEQTEGGPGPGSPPPPSLDSAREQRGQDGQAHGHVSRAGVGGAAGSMCGHQGPGEESRHGQTAWGRRAAHGSVPPKWAHSFLQEPRYWPCLGPWGREN